MSRTLVDLFAGSGGLGLGMEGAGFTPVFVSELDPNALRTYLVNRPGAPVQAPENHAGDLLNLTQSPRSLYRLANRLREDFGDIDLVAGGPPCQGYSGIGHRRTFTGLAKQDIPSNHLYREMATFISAVGPKAFVFENVRGLLSSKWTRDGVNGEVWRDVLATLEGITWESGAGPIGYTVRQTLVRARDYGVPQNRPRIIVVGIRKDLEFEPVDGAPAAGLVPFPTRLGPDIIDALGDLMDPDWHPGMQATAFYPRPAQTELQRRFRTYPGQVRARRVGAPVSDHEYSRHSPLVQARFEALRQFGRHGLPHELQTKKFAQRVLPERWGSAGPNITVASLADDYVHFGQARSLTVREWARLQTFPDWYQFVGKRTTGGRRRAGDPEAGDWTREVPKYTQIGNAVPVFLAEAIGKHLNGVLSDCEGGEEHPLSVEDRLSA